MSPQVKAIGHPKILSRALVVLVAIQILLAFLGLPVVLHWVLGGLVGVLAASLLYLTMKSPVSVDLRRLSLALAIDLGLQPLLLLLGRFAPAAQGLHGINGIVALGLALLVAIESEEVSKTP